MSKEKKEEESSDLSTKTNILIQELDKLCEKNETISHLVDIVREQQVCLFWNWHQAPKSLQYIFGLGGDEECIALMPVTCEDVIHTIVLRDDMTSYNRNIIRSEDLCVIVWFH